MEICVAAAKIAGKGTKKMWDNFTPEQCSEFIKMRTEKYAEKYPSGSDFYKKRMKKHSPETKIKRLTSYLATIKKRKDLAAFVKYSDELDNT